MSFDEAENRTRLAGIVRGHHAMEKRELACRFRREMTKAEAVLWKAIRASRLGGLHFRRQQIIDGFIVDFFCHSAALIIEVDGPVHEEQAEYDAAREEVLRQRKLRIIRFTNDDVLKNLPTVLQRIQESTTK